MKRFFFFLGSNLLLAGLAQAQIGVRVGTNLLNFNTSASNGARPSTSSRLGYQAGIYYQQPLTKRFSLVPEVQFSSEQGQVNSDNYRNAHNYSLNDYRLHLSYLNVPMLLRFALGRVYLEAGPQASLLIGGRGSGQGSYLVGGDSGGDYAIDQSSIDRFRRLQYGACVGIGVSLPAGLGLSVRAYQGFTSMNQITYSQDRAAIPYWAGNMQRQTLQASLTYQLASRYKIAVIKI